MNRRILGPFLVEPQKRGESSTHRVPIVFVVRPIVNKRFAVRGDEAEVKHGAES
jgi:hypothetical protein